MNDEGLTPREHSEMRDIVLAGTQRIKPAGSHRAQFAAAAIALVLVGAVSGGALTTAAIFGADSAGPAVTATPTVTTTTPTAAPPPPSLPSETPPPAVVPAQARLPFGGSCDEAFTLDEVGALLGTPVIHADPRWPTGENDVLGGLQCRWADASPSPHPTLVLAIYPDVVVPDAYRTDVVTPVCEQRENWDPSAAPCVLTGIAGTTWYSLSVFPGVGDQAMLAQMGDLIAERIAAYGEPAAPVPSDGWWSLPDCSWLDANVDLASALGFDSQQLRDLSLAINPLYVGDLPAAAGSIGSCRWLLQDESESLEISVRVVPGAGDVIQDIASSDGAEPLSLPGAVAATTATDDQFWEWYHPVLAASDGTNLLIVQRVAVDDFTRVEVTDLAPLATDLLALLGG